MGTTRLACLFLVCRLFFSVCVWLAGFVFVSVPAWITCCCFYPLGEDWYTFIPVVPVSDLEVVHAGLPYSVTLTSADTDYR